VLKHRGITLYIITLTYKIKNHEQESSHIGNQRI